MVTAAARAWVVGVLLPAGLAATSQAPGPPSETEDCVSYDVSLLQVELDFGRAEQASVKGNAAAARAEATVISSVRGRTAGLEVGLVAAFGEQSPASQCKEVPGLWDVAISPQGDRIASGSCDKTVRVYDLSRTPGFLLATLTDATDMVSSVAFWDDEAHGLILGAADLAGAWRLYNATPSLGMPQLLATRHEGSPLEGIAISRDTPLMATATSGGSARLWMIDPPGNPAVVQEVLPAGEHGPTIPALTPLGNRLGLGFHDGSLKVWSTNKSGLFIRDEITLGGHVNNVVFSRSNDLLAAASWDGSVSLYGNIFVPGGNMRLLSSIMDASATRVNSVAFNHDDTLLAAGYADGKVRVFDLADPADPHLLATLSDNEGAIRSVEFGGHGGPDSPHDLLLTAGSDGKVRLYHVQKQ